jgi:hypothetical protein
MPVSTAYLARAPKCLSPSLLGAGPLPRQICIFALQFTLQMRNSGLHAFALRTQGFLC